MKKLMLFAMAILLCGCSGNTKKEETKKKLKKTVLVFFYLKDYIKR